MSQARDSERQLPPELFAVEQLFGPGSDLVLTELSNTGEKRVFGPDQLVLESGGVSGRLYLLIKGAVYWAADYGNSSVITVCPVCSPVVFGFAEAIGGNIFRGNIRPITECEFIVVDVSAVDKILRNRVEICFNLCRALSGLCYQSLKLLHDSESKYGAVIPKLL